MLKYAESSPYPDRCFTAANRKNVEDSALLMGKNNVAILGKNNKAKYTYWYTNCN